MTPQSLILDCLRWHIGESQAISADDLLYMLRSFGSEVHNVSQLRGMIRDLRQAGQLIGSCQRGYFIPDTLAEALAYVEREFRGPARDQLKTARRQREAAKMRFGGQMELFK